MSGYLLAGFFSDRYGRRPTIQVLAVVSAMANLLPLMFRSHLAVMVARFLAGISADTTCSIVYLLGKEDHRMPGMEPMHSKSGIFTDL